MRRSIPLVLAAAVSMLALDGLAQSAEPAPFHGDVEALAAEHDDFRRVLYTGRVQLVLMTLRPGEDIGEETHDVDQCFFVIDGRGEALLEGESSSLDDRHVVCVPAGTRHNVRNTADEPLKLVTVYGPPQHAPGTVHATRADAMRAEESEH